MELNFDDITVVGLDVDGTLTDGSYNISDNGVITKGFFTRDFYSLHRLRASGLEVIIITGSNDDVIDKKLATTQVKGIQIIKNSSDKHADFLSWLQARSLSWKNAAFIGDAENDLKVMESVAWSACPADAVNEVKNMSNYVSSVCAGHGAVYDCVRVLCKEKGLDWQ